jgi:hypothetical protein
MISHQVEKLFHSVMVIPTFFVDKRLIGNVIYPEERTGCICRPDPEWAERIERGEENSSYNPFEKSPSADGFV